MSRKTRRAPVLRGVIGPLLARTLVGLVFPGLLALLAACTTSIPADDFYRLQVKAPLTLSRPTLPGVVEVRRFGAMGLTGQRALLYSYSDKPDQVLRYGYQFWTEPPPVLLQDQLVAVLRQAHAADLVVIPGFRVSADYVIDGRLRRFEQVAGGSPAVVVDMEIGVMRSRDHKLLLLKGYRVKEPSASDRAGDAVAAYQAAVQELFAQFLNDLSGLSANS